MGFTAVCKRELKRLSSRRLYLLITIVFPLVSVLFFALLFRSGIPENLPVAVFDADNSAFSRQLTRNLDANQILWVKFQLSSLDEIKKHMLSGEIYGAIYIPARFEAEVLKGSGPEVICFYNNAYLLTGGLISKEVTLTVSAFSSSIAAQNMLRAGESHLKLKTSGSPVQLDAHVLYNPTVNYFYYLATAFMPIMLLIFILTATVYVIGIEWKESTAANWLQTAGGNITKALAGKLAPYFLIYFILVEFVNLFIFKYFNVPQVGSQAALHYNAVVFVLAYMACGIFIAALFKSLRLSLSVSSVFAALAFTFSGLTFPYQGMDKWVAFFGNFFPYSHYLKIFIDQSFKNNPIIFSLQDFLWLHAFLILPFFVLPQLKKMCHHPKYWGKS